MVLHFALDGDIIIKDSEEARDQEEFWDQKKQTNKGLLDKINVAIKEEFGKDPRKFCPSPSDSYYNYLPPLLNLYSYIIFKSVELKSYLKYCIVEGNEKAQKKSLRNQFNFQERAAQTFNLPLREKGIKTDPPQCSTFSLETTQWMVFDAYMQ